MNPLFLLLLAGGGYVAYKKIHAAPAQQLASPVVDPSAGMSAEDTALFNQMMTVGQTPAQNASGQ